MRDVTIRDRDIRRVAQAIHRHLTTKPTDPFRGRSEEWSAMRFAILAYPILIHHGYIATTKGDT